MKYRLLRVLLFVAAFGWAVAVLGVVLPWSTALIGLRGFGAGEIPYDPMIDYWMRMAAGAFTGIGIFIFVVATRPDRFRNVIGLIGALSVLEGAVLLIHGIRLGLAPFPFYGDTLFCLVVGVGIWILRKETSSVPGPERDHRIPEERDE